MLSECFLIVAINQWHCTINQLDKLMMHKICLRWTSYQSLHPRNSWSHVCAPTPLFFYPNPVEIHQSMFKQEPIVHICGVIKQNQSEVGQIQFPVFFLTASIIFTATFCRKPHWNWSIGSKDKSIQRMPKTIGNKRHFLLYLALS